MSNLFRYRISMCCAIWVVIYFVLPRSTYFNGFITGVMLAALTAYICVKFLYYDQDSSLPKSSQVKSVQIFEVPAVKEYQPLKKYEVNYDFCTHM